MSVHYLGLALLHFSWQGAAAAALLASLELLLRPRSPGVRYALATATLLGMLLLPAATYFVLAGGAEADLAPISTGDRLELAGRSGALALRPLGASLVAGERIRPWLPVLVGAWGAGVALFSVRLLGGLALVARLKRSATETVTPGLADRFHHLCRALRLSRGVRLCESALVEVPTVVGWLRPVILLPAGVVLGLSPAQIESILAHELAHIRRFDGLVSLGQAVTETLLFYHPAVWWVSRRMRIEREHCCDDVAVAICGDAVSYSRALTRLAQDRPTAPALALAINGGSLFQRIARLVEPAPPAAPRRVRGLAALVVLSLLTALALGSAVSAHRSDPAMTSLRSAPKGGSDAAPKATPTPSLEATEPALVEAAPTDEPGRTVVPLGKVIALADAGVTAEYIDEMAALGFRALSPNQLLELSAEGIEPDFVRGMKKLNAGDLSLVDLLALHSQGVTPEYVAELEELGLGQLSVARLIGLAGAGVTSEYVHEMKALLDEPLSVPLLIELQNHGVSSEFVKDMKDLGYGRLGAQTLIELVDNGVDSEYVRELKDAGYPQFSAKDLVELRSHGVEVELMKRLIGNKQESAR